MDAQAVRLRADIARIRVRLDAIKDAPLELLTPTQQDVLHEALNANWHHLTHTYRWLNNLTDDAERIDADSTIE